MNIVEMKNFKNLNATVNGQYFLRDIKKVVNGKTYLTLSISDVTGEIGGKVWSGYLRDEYMEYKNSVVIIQGTVAAYNGETHVNITSMTKSDMELVNLGDFFPSENSPEKYYEAFVNQAKSYLKKSHFIDLFDKFFIENDSLARKLQTLQGGVKLHHATVGGWIKHTYYVLSHCVHAAKMYNSDIGISAMHKNFDVELLVLGAAMHDIGKMLSYELPPINERTTEDKLLGHIISGTSIISRVIAKIKDFPKEDELKLLHIVASSHGEIATSPVTPMCVEAAIVSVADLLDSKVDSINKLIKNDPDENSDFTKHDYVFGRSFYKK